MALPVCIPVTMPVASTEAIVADEVVQLPPVVVLLRVSAAPTVVVNVPVIALTVSGVVGVTLITMAGLVAVGVLTQLDELVSTQLMVSLAVTE